MDPIEAIHRNPIDRSDGVQRLRRVEKRRLDDRDEPRRETPERDRREEPPPDDDMPHVDVLA